MMKGPYKGEGYKCIHCAVTKKRMPPAEECSEDAMACGCSKDKGVFESLLVEKGILVGKNDDTYDDDDLARRLKTITQGEWFKIDHIMGALFGFKLGWLLDSKEMKAGLLKAYNSVGDGVVDPNDENS